MSARVQAVKVLLERGGTVTRGDVEHLVDELEALAAQLEVVQTDAEELAKAAEQYVEACLASSSIEAFEALPTILAGWREKYLPQD